LLVKQYGNLTPGYASGTIQSEGRRGPSTDFYALCASMYELITGQLPKQQTDFNQKCYSPSRLVPNIDTLTEQIILSGMKIAGERFQTADELIAALKGKFVSPSQKSTTASKQGKLLEAVQAYEKCLVNEPTNGEAAVELALVQTYINDSQAEAAAQKAIQLQTER